MALNVVAISGNLGSDAELRQTQAGTNILSFTVAVNERRKDQSGEWSDYTNWVDCTVFGKRAESLAQYLTKGMKVSVQGRLHQSKWQRDGQTRSKLEVIVDDLDFMSARPQGYNDQGQDSYSGVSPQVAYAAQQAQAASGYGDLYDESIPFD